MKSYSHLFRSPFALLALAMVFVFAVSSCKKDPDDPNDPNDNNEQELITTLIFSFTDTSSSTNTLSFAFRDPDGDGGAAPTQFDTLRFPANSTFNGALQLLDESDANDVEDITVEILAEDDEHLFCYTVSSGLDMEVIRTDSDGNFPIGVATRWRAGAASTGTVRVTLKHQPGVKDGSCTPGDTDVEVNFVVEIQ